MSLRASTEAKHLEMVFSLITDTCQNAVTQFIARQGHTSTIWSDNCTNFVGANIELKQFASMRQNSYFQENIFQMKIVWKFNVAAAPHFGGSWQRMLKTCKQATYHVLNGQMLTDELLATVLCVTQHFLICRLLMPNTYDPSDMEALTPHHFLFGPAEYRNSLFARCAKVPKSQKDVPSGSSSHGQQMVKMAERVAVHNIRQKCYKERPQGKK